MYLLLLPHIMALFMMSLSDAAGHKMQHSRLCFHGFQTSLINRDSELSEQLKKTNKQKRYMYVFYSIPVDVACDASLLRYPFSCSSVDSCAWIGPFLLEK